MTESREDGASSPLRMGDWRPEVFARPPRTVEADPKLSGAVIFLFAIACGLSVASVTYAQPLIEVIARDFGLSTAHAGGIVTVTQIGYAVGLLLITPLGDLLNRRRLIVAQLLVSALASLGVAMAQTESALFVGMAALGLLAVVIQVVLAYAATLAPPEQRGRVVGVVTSGLVLGLFSARSFAGLITDLAGWRSVFLMSAGATICVAVGLWASLPKSEPARATMSYSSLLRSLIALFAEEPVLRSRAAMATLIFAASSIFWTSMALQLSAPPLALSHAAIGLFGLSSLAAALAAARAGRLADRGWTRQAGGAALFLLVLAWPLMSVMTSALWMAALGVVLLDVAVQIVHVTNQTTLYAVRPLARSRLVAGYMLFYSIGGGAGSIASTLVYAEAGWIGVCTLGAVVSALALALWAIGFRQSRAIIPIAEGMAAVYERSEKSGLDQKANG